MSACRWPSAARCGSAPSRSSPRRGRTATRCSSSCPGTTPPGSAARPMPCAPCSPPARRPPDEHRVPFPSHRERAGRLRLNPTTPVCRLVMLTRSGQRFPDNPEEGDQMPAVRLSDVAQDAGVSLATASRALNGSSRIPGKAVAEKVRASADRLGYVPNAQAQALARSRSGLVGLVVHGTAEPCFATIARGAQPPVVAAQSQVLRTQPDREIDAEIRALRSLIAQQVDALVLVGSHRYGTESDAAISALLEGFERNGGTVVGLGQALG